MTRRLLLTCFAAIAAACSRPKQSLKEMLPKEVKGPWVLQGMQDLDPAAAPELLRNLGVEQSLEAQYAGNGAIKVRVYRMRGGASAFEAMQKWPQGESLALERGTFFITAQGDGVSRQSLIDFLHALNTDIKIPG
jgi:hypothetical protein